MAGDAPIEAEAPHPWASRGGVKLAAALDAFALDPAGLICLDIGASTGGFTDVLLARGAAKVIAVDVGHGQLDPRLAADPRVRSLEGVDARTLTAETLGEPPSAIVIDVSFISQRLVLPHVLKLATSAGVAGQPRQAAVRARPKQISSKAGSRAKRRSSAHATACAPRSKRKAGRCSASSRRRSSAAPGRGNSSSPRAMTEPFEEVSIVALDAHGHGLAANGAIVPGALPGERTLVTLEGKRAELVETLDPSPERAAPICPWFGTCGGCVAQHMSASLYRRWKRELVVDALEREGVAAEVGDLVDAHGAGRRRATFHARFPHGQPDEVGFMRARSHDIIAIDDCPLFSPGMAGAIPAAHALSGDLRGLMKPLDIGVTATLDGLDVDLRGSGPLGRAEEQKLVQTADALDLARVSNHGEIVIERRAPRVAFGERLGEAAARRLPAGDRGGRSVARGLCRAGVCRARKELRTCSAARARSRSRLARGHEVFAVDADPAAIAALARAAATTPGLRTLAADDARSLPPSAARLTNSRRSTRRSWTRRAPARSNRRARSPPPRCRSSYPSHATRRLSPATRAFSSMAAFGLNP